MNVTAIPIQTGVLDLINQAGWVVKGVLLMLLFSSLVCWAIIFMKQRLLRLADHQNTKFLKTFWQSKSLDEIFSKLDGYALSPVALVFKSGFKELQKLSLGDRPQTSGGHEIDNVHRALARASQAQVARLEKHVSWLATTASAAPFVGLFGTVWGIMNSFRKIGATGAANLSVVAPGISEALIATAIGLAAAIPAAIAYNHFVNAIKRQTVDMDCFTQDFLNIVQRGLMTGGKK